MRSSLMMALVLLLTACAVHPAPSIANASLTLVPTPLPGPIFAPVVGPGTPVTQGPPPPTTFSTALNAGSDFVGASIVQRWQMPLHNDGISGETTTQVLARFKTTVLNHGYTRVIILCGTNDVLQGTKDLPTEAATNIQSMASIAKDAGMDVVLSKLPPIMDSGTDYRAALASVNNSIAQLAAQQGYALVDYYAALDGHPEAYVDNLHPNSIGYALMEKALAAVVLH